MTLIQKEKRKKFSQIFAIRHWSGTFFVSCIRIIIRDWWDVKIKPVWRTKTIQKVNMSVSRLIQFVFKLYILVWYWKHACTPHRRKIDRKLLYQRYKMRGDIYIYIFFFFFASTKIHFLLKFGQQIHQNRKIIWQFNVNMLKKIIDKTVDFHLKIKQTFLLHCIIRVDLDIVSQVM